MTTYAPADELELLREKRAYLAALEDRKLRVDHGRRLTADHLATPGALAAYCSKGRAVTPPHLALVDEALCDIDAGRLDRLAVFMPPRHGKSERISHYAPPWLLARDPDRRIMLTSYEADFAGTWGRKAREVIEEHPELGVTVRDDSKAANRWDLAGHDGGMVTAGVGGPMTGKGAHVLVIDDPVKNAEEANSTLARERAWDWWLSTAQPRLEPGGAVVLVMTRWHEDDLAGRLLASEPGRWRVISLPALAEPDDPLGRPPGGALWADRYPAAKLTELRQSMGSYWFSALYQQRPQPVEGGLFKRASFRYWRNHGSFATGDHAYRLLAPAAGGGVEDLVPVGACRKFTTVDVAASTRTSADFSVACTWAVTPYGQLVLVDRIRQRLEGPDLLPMLRTVMRVHSPTFIGVEKATYGLTLLQEARRAHLPVRELLPDSDKVSRALVAAARCEAGEVFFPADAGWLGEWEAELLGFPTGAHDDQVDAFAYAAHELALGRVAAPRPREDSTEDKIWRQLTERRRGTALHDTLGRI